MIPSFALPKLPVVPNHWADPKCARAFWSQSELPVFQQLVEATLAAAAPAAGEDWLDLGCGGGTLTRGLWDRSHGRIGSILGVDCNAANAQPYAIIAAERNAPHRIRFQKLNFSHGLAPLQDGQFDGIISGLAISYAEHYDETRGEWTQQAYDHLLAEAARVLKPSGRFVFSVNVPNPSWWIIGLKSLPGGLLRSPRPLRFLRNSRRMLRYGRWLKQEARRGRFHYLPAATVAAKLRQAGFNHITHSLGYSSQAYIFRAERGG